VTTRETNANRQHQQRERERETFKKRSNRKKKRETCFAWSWQELCRQRWCCLYLNDNNSKYLFNNNGDEYEFKWQRWRGNQYEW